MAPGSISHISIADDLAELCLPYGALLSNGLELCLERLAASGGVPRFSLAAALDVEGDIKLTMCSFGRSLDFRDGMDLTIETLSMQLRSVGGQLDNLRDSSIGSVLQLELPT